MKRLIAIAALSLLAACTAEQVYNTGQTWQVGQCTSADSSERDRCTTQPRPTYEEYKAQK